MHDFKFAFRQLLKNPGFTAVAVLTLALGIGANTAIFSVVDRLLVRPLPVTEPEKLALLGQSRGEGRVEYEFNYPLFRDYQRENKVFSQLSATAEQSVGLGTGGATERQKALLVSGNYFSMLGVNAALGRTFAPNEGVEPDDAPVVILSHALWERRFGADPTVLNRPVTVNGEPYTVVGVAPREFAGTTRGFTPDLYVPITMLSHPSPSRPGEETRLNSRYYTWHWIMGRLKDGVTSDQASAALNVLARQADTARLPNTSTNLVLLPGAQGFSANLQEARMPLNLLLGAAGLVLLIACANLANLQLARATGRSREFAIRIALGSRPWRLIRGLLAESLLISLAGGSLGLAVAIWLVDVLTRFRPLNANISVPIGLDSRALLFTLAASVGTGILFGLFPALRASRPQIVPELKSGSSGATEARMGRWNLRSGLVILQVSLSLTVLIGAGLCIRSLQKLQKIDPGFEPSRILLSSFDLGLNNYTPPQAKAFYDQLLEQVRTFPGVEAASLSANTPLSGDAPGMSLERVEDDAAKPGEQTTTDRKTRPVGDINFVSDDYFRAISVPLLRGRDFAAADAANSPPVVIINAAFAKRFFKGADPLGRRIYQHGPNGGIPTEVVGVVESTRSRRLTDSARPAMYFPLSQRPDRALTLSIRTGLDPAATISQLRQLVRSLDANVPIFGIRKLSQQRDSSLALQRMAATLLSGFGVLALFLAALGIYGVLAYSVNRRTREIGVRIALGAQVADVLQMVIRQGFGLTAIGIVIGLIGAVAGTRLLRGFLYEIQPLDPTTFLTVSILLALAALGACWLPARRAARVDPMVALRTE